MDAYIYSADLYCAECADAIKADLAGSALDNGDSDTYPQGPYVDGGGESDTPQHCARCGVYLDAPLTEAGVEYAHEALGDAIRAFLDGTGGRREPLETWARDLNGYAGPTPRQTTMLHLYYALPAPATA